MFLKPEPDLLFKSKSIKCRLSLNKFVDLKPQRGTALMESLLALLPVLLIGSLGIELARGYQVRHLLTLAMHETARVAAVHHGNPKHWQPQLNQSLSRLHLPPGRFASARDRMEAERHHFQRRYGQPMWQTEQIGTEAHTIHLKLTYLYRPMQPWLRAMLGKLFDTVPAWSGASAYSQAAWRQGLIPIVVEYQVLRHRSTTPTTF